MIRLPNGHYVRADAVHQIEVEVERFFDPEFFPTVCLIVAPSGDDCYGFLLESFVFDTPQAARDCAEAIAMAICNQLGRPLRAVVCNTLPPQRHAGPKQRGPETDPDGNVVRPRFGGRCGEDASDD